MIPAAIATPAVDVADVHRRFGDRTVLAGIDLRIDSGEVVALLGPSGTGKSTLLRILAGLDRGFTGSAAVPSARAVVFQDPRLVPWRRVAANVALGLRGPEPLRRAEAMLRDVGLGAHLRSWPATLSGGEAQRAALARALVRSPDLLLLDEPFGALDALTRVKMHGLLGDLLDRFRPATLLVTHDVNEAIALADRCVVLDRGRIVLDRAVARDPDGMARRAEDLRRDLLEQLGVGRPERGTGRV